MSREELLEGIVSVRNIVEDLDEQVVALEGKIREETASPNQPQTLETLRGKICSIGIRAGANSLSRELAECLMELTNKLTEHINTPIQG